MAAAAEDLGVVSACAVALGLLYLLLFVTTVVFAVVDNIGALGFYPFRSASRHIDGAITSGLNAAIKSVDKVMAAFLSDLADSLAVLLGFALIVLILVKDALTYLWNHALRPLVEWYVGPIRTTANSALTKVTALAGTVADDLTETETYARARAADATRTALSILRPEIQAAEHAAERYADEAVATLRTAEDTAIGHALAVAVEAQAAGIAAAAHAATEAEGIAAAALASSKAAAREALARVKAIAIDAEHELDVIAAGRDAAGLAALIASIPLLATFVHTLATDTGLENQECRSKVKGICGTDPSQWESLLGLFAPIGFGFTLAELLPLARQAIKDLTPIIREAA